MSRSCTRSGGVSPTHLRGPVRPSFGVPGDIKGKEAIWLEMLWGWLWRVKIQVEPYKIEIDYCWYLYLNAAVSLFWCCSSLCRIWVVNQSLWKMRSRNHSNSHFNLVQGYLAVPKIDQILMDSPKTFAQNNQNHDSYHKKPHFRKTNKNTQTQPFKHHGKFIELQIFRETIHRGPPWTNSSSHRNPGLRPNVPGGPVRMPGWRPGWWGHQTAAKKLSWKWGKYLYFPIFLYISLRMC